MLSISSRSSFPVTLHKHFQQLNPQLALCSSFRKSHLCHLTQGFGNFYYHSKGLAAKNFETCFSVNARTMNKRSLFLCLHSSRCDLLLVALWVNWFGVANYSFERLVLE